VSRIAYVNGRYLAFAQARVHVEDRGFQFADGVYEVCEVIGGRLVDARRHLDRLERSLEELRIAWPVTRPALGVILHEVVARNLVEDGLVYLQVTRGVARRDFPFPTGAVRPTLVVIARSIDRAANTALAQEGVAVVTRPDNRWERVDIKSINLLPNVLAKQAAREAGAREAWFVDERGFVTEGGSSNAWIVTPGGSVVTRPAEGGILRGVTRTTLLDLLRQEGLKLEERAFKLEEAARAREAFITAATTLVMPVVRIDGEVVGNGKPGPLTLALRQKFHRVAELS
jgi:D-alanine transaminase